MTDALIHHAFVSGFPDVSDATVVRPSNWNASLVLSAGTDGQVLTRDSGSATGASWTTGGGGGYAGGTSASLEAIISDPTGTGKLVFGTSPTIVTPTIASFVNATHTHLNAAGGGLLTTAAISDLPTAVVAFSNKSGNISQWTNDASYTTLAGVAGVGYALLASPTFTGVPAGPTAAPGTNTTQLATTAFVHASSAPPGGSDTQIQFNNAGAFGGSANLTWDGTHLTTVLVSAAGLSLPTNASTLAAVPIRGTTTANATLAVVGVGTHFLADVPVGSGLVFSSAPSDSAFVVDVADDTHLTLAGNWTGSAGPFGDGTVQTLAVLLPNLSVQLAFGQGYVLADASGAYAPTANFKAGTGFNQDHLLNATGGVLTDHYYSYDVAATGHPLTDPWVEKLNRDISIVDGDERVEWFGGATSAWKVDIAHSLVSSAYPGSFGGSVTAPTFIGALTGNASTATSAAKWTTARTLAGNSVDGSANVAFVNKVILQGTTDAGFSAAQFLGALATGILKNTTTTGVLSIAVGADIPNIAESQVTGLVSDIGTLATAIALRAPLASPALTGVPTAPTAAGGTNTTQIASTAFVTAALVGVGSGTVTSVGLSLPGLFTLSGTPVTTSGTLTAVLATQTANLIWAGPTSGAAATPTFRAMVGADVPTLNQNTSGSAATLTTPRSIYGNSFDGSAALAQIIASTYGGTGNGFTKFSGPTTTEKTFTLPNASATVLTDNALVTVAQGGIGIGTLASNGVLYGQGTSAVLALAVNATATNKFLTQVSSGAPAWATILAGDVPTLNQNTSGSAATLTTPRAINGTNFDGSAAITVTAAAGTLTGSTLAAGVTASSLTSVGTLATLSVTATITGSISGNAATVTTNANLTGVITSVGNATSIASQTGTGTKFVVDTSPTLVTPVLGVASGTSLALTSFASSTQSIGVTSTDGVLLATGATAATSILQQWSPRLHFTASGWKTTATAAAQALDFIVELQPVVETTAAQNRLVFSSQTAAGGYIPVFKIVVDGVNAPGAGDYATIWQSSGNARGMWSGASGCFVAGVDPGTGLTPATDGGSMLVALGLRMRSTASVSWSTGTDPNTSLQGGTNLFSDASYVLALRSTTNASKFRIYNTFTTIATAGEWWKEDWQTTANQFRFGAAMGTSTGTARVASWDYGAKEASPTAAITVPISSGSIVFGGAIQLSTAAVTGLVAGVLAASTNASIVLVDSAGQTYRIPCVI